MEKTLTFFQKNSGGTHKKSLIFNAVVIVVTAK
jgi:hypothetical protein